MQTGVLGMASGPGMGESEIETEARNPKEIRRPTSEAHGVSGPGLGAGLLRMGLISYALSDAD